MVVFDLDETLGHFSQFSIFYDCLYSCLKTLPHFDHFYELLDLFPEYLRPNIMDILEFIKIQKQDNKCSNVMIYTNNQGEKDWTLNIKKYFNKKLKYELFDRVIGAFKVNGKRVELCRSSHDKTIRDFINCTEINKNTKICFIDDVLYHNMTGANVYYINIKPYIRNIVVDEMITRVESCTYFKRLIKNKRSFNREMNTHYNNYNYRFNEIAPSELALHKMIGKKILQHIKIFFGPDDNLGNNSNNNKSKKKERTTNSKNKTKKRPRVK
uniref:FCP1 homology domain-containing protein n=1 Tax=viral metagenome TaxID=1070528 RepID=A0A6C0LK45_9ZZZZ